MTLTAQTVTLFQWWRTFYAWLSWSNYRG